MLQALMGHDHVDSSTAYVHLAPVHLRATTRPADSMIGGRDVGAGVGRTRASRMEPLGAWRTGPPHTP